MAGRFCVTLTHCRQDPDKATVAFVVANAALGSEKETMMFLSSDGVWAASKSEVAAVDIGEPFSALQPLVEKFLAGGGKLLVCTPCLKKRGIGDDDLVDGAQPAGGAALVEWLSNDPACVAY